METRRNIRLFAADDCPMILAGLRGIVGATEDIELIGEATSGPDAINRIPALAPDVAVLDISMRGLNGILVARRLVRECPAVRVLIFTGHESRAYLQQALDAGARGYLLKSADTETLLRAVRAVYVGGLYVDPAICGQVFGASQARFDVETEKNTVVSLSERERGVLRLAARGYTNKEIAGQIGITTKSVETYRARGAEKLGLTSRAEIVRFASMQGWLVDL